MNMERAIQGFLVVLCCVAVWGPVGPVYAQDAALLPVLPTGPKGRYTKEEAEILALRILPGEIVARDVDYQQRKLYYEFTIAVPDGSVYELEMNAVTGELYEIEVESLSADPVLPFTILDEGYARSLAVSLVDEREKGQRKPKVLKTRVDVFKRNLAYFFTVHKVPREFEVVIDAQKGTLLSYERVD